MRLCGLSQIRAMPSVNVIKGSGNSRRVREALRFHKQEIFGSLDQLRAAIAKNLDRKRADLGSKKRMISSDVG